MSAARKPRVVHLYNLGGGKGTTLCVHFDHKMWVPAGNTMLEMGDLVRVRPVLDTLRVYKLIGDIERAETWTLRKDV